MHRYHVNPDTGNANICRAKIKCRFGGDDHHFPEPQAARAHYEQSMAQSGFNGLMDVKLSRGARVLRALALAQEDLEVYHAKMAESIAIDDGFNQRVDIRNRCKKALRDLPWDFSDAPTFDDETTVALEGLNHVGGEDRQGYSNLAIEVSEDEEKIYRRLDEAGAAWASRLSTGEIKAVAIYNEGATEYARTMCGEAGLLEPEAVRGLHSALAKAPRLEKPMRTYAGISNERCRDIQSQGNSGEIILDRIQSSSANPAQVNGFMFSFSEDESLAQEIAVEFFVDRAASLSAFNLHRGEMELLVPPGRYAVKERLEKVTYNWPGRVAGKPFGRTSAFTYVVKPLASTLDV